MNHFYVYKCIFDDGGAPCIDFGLFSLCICKPNIRSTAQVGDVIFAFGSNNESPANRLIYIAEVTRKLTRGKYYVNKAFQYRSDCIYELAATCRFKIRVDAKHHGSTEAMVRDIGRPPEYKRANSLLSDNFRYFGNKGTDDWKLKSPALTRLVESLQQGHRVNHNRNVRDELLKIQQTAWSTHQRKIMGKPLHGSRRRNLSSALQLQTEELLKQSVRRVTALN